MILMVIHLWHFICYCANTTLRMHPISMFSWHISANIYLTSKTFNSNQFTAWWETDGCENHYIYELAVYFMAVVLSTFKLKFDRLLIAPKHGKGFCWWVK